jgi:type IV secretion system protein VirB6
MACPAIASGSQFLTTTLAHIDCQSRHIGSYGYGALADPGSAVSIALTGLLTLFVAIFGMRLLGGYVADGRDAISDFLRLGIVLLLATSWPAWRVVGYEVVLDAPSEIAEMISGGPDAPSSSDNLRQRLQNADDGLMTITAYGSGRLPDADLRDEFRGIALADETGFAWGRVIFLLGVIAPYAVVHLAAGILLSLAPLLAGTLLFLGSRSLFHGWIRGLLFSMLGSLVITLLQAVSLAILEPWIASVTALRGSGAFTPSAPTEMAVMSLVFAVATVGVLILLARLTFLPYVSVRTINHDRSRLGAPALADRSLSTNAGDGSQPRSRANVIADSVATAIRRESQAAMPGRGISSPNLAGANDTADRYGSEIYDGEILGSKYRRDYRRSAASMRRDHKP